MARSVNLTITSIEKTGQQIAVDQYEVTIGAEWTDADGQIRTRTETVRFPNLLGQMTGVWLKENLTDLLIRGARVHYGIDEE